MATKKKAAPTRRSEAREDAGVAEFIRTLEHPLKKEIEALRRIVLGVSPEILEGIKWNAPSFRTTNDFATMNLRSGEKAGTHAVWLILHTGAKAKKREKDLTIADPGGLLKWLAKDRAVVTFSDAKDVKNKRAGLEEIIKAWIEQL